MGKQLKGTLILLLAAAIWGGAFVAQSVGNSIGSFSFNGIRSIIGSLSLLPVIFINDSFRRKRGEDISKLRKNTFLPGMLCGIFLTTATTLQQFALNYTTAGKGGFLTATYIVIVPIILLVISKLKKEKQSANIPPLRMALGVVISLAGMYLLCLVGSGEKGFNKGDILMLCCAVAFSFHIILIDRTADKVDYVRMSCIQFAVCGIICGAASLIFEQPTLREVAASWIPLAYVGILSSALAYTLQMIGQKYSDPTVASLVMSMESVFSVISGWLFLNETLTLAQFIGCCLMFAAIILVQIPAKPKDKAI